MESFIFFKSVGKTITMVRTTLSVNRANIQNQVEVIGELSRKKRGIPENVKAWNVSNVPTAKKAPASKMENWTVPPSLCVTHACIAILNDTKIEIISTIKCMEAWLGWKGLYKSEKNDGNINKMTVEKAKAINM